MTKKLSRKKFVELFDVLREDGPRVEYRFPDKWGVQANVKAASRRRPKLKVYVHKEDLLEEQDDDQDS